VMLTSVALALLANWIKLAIQGRISVFWLGIALSIGTVGMALAAVFLPIYFQRQRLQTLRQKAARDIEVLTSNLAALDRSAATALTLVKEVEIVSRGFLW
jgi:hypothetical protein